MRTTWVTGSVAADQTGEGGKTTAPPENQISLVRGSAEMTVIWGRLKDKRGKYRASKHTSATQQILRGSSFGNGFFNRLLSLVWSLWQDFTRRRRTGLICLNFSYLANYIFIFPSEPTVFDSSL